MTSIKAGYPNQASGFPFSQEQIDLLLSSASECALNWTTQDGWAVGVMHLYVWHEGKIWLNFMGHRHRAAAIRRDPRVSVIVSSRAAPHGGPQGQVTIKGRATFHDDDEDIRQWHYRMLAAKEVGENRAAIESFVSRLTNPIRAVLEIEPVKWITFDFDKLRAFENGTDGGAYKTHLKSADTKRLQAELERRGLTLDES